MCRRVNILFVFFISFPVSKRPVAEKQQQLDDLTARLGRGGGTGGRYVVVAADELQGLRREVERMRGREIDLLAQSATRSRVTHIPVRCVSDFSFG